MSMTKGQALLTLFLLLLFFPIPVLASAPSRPSRF